MTSENSGPTAAEDSAAIFDPLHVVDRIAGCVMGAYVIGVGGLSIWRVLAGPEAWNWRQLLLGIFFAGILGPAAIYLYGFRSRSRARAIPLGMVKRVVGSLAGFLAAALGMCTMWIAVFPLETKGAGKGLDWDMFLGASAIVALGLYGLYACAWRGVDVADFSSPV